MAEKNTWEFSGEQLFMFGTGGNKFEKTRGVLRRGNLVMFMNLVLDLPVSLGWRLYLSVGESLKEY